MGFVSTFVSLPCYYALLYSLLAKSAAAGLRWTPIGQLWFGLAMGYVFASLAESWQHRFFGHQATRLRTMLWQRLGSFGWRLRRAYWLHNVIHHIKTHRKNFVTLFASAEDKEALHASLSMPEVDFIVYREYGLSIPLSSYPLFMWMPMLICPMLLRFVGSVSVLASIPPMLLAPALSMYVHPLVHKPYPEVLAETKGFLHWFMQVRFAAIARLPPLFDRCNRPRGTERVRCLLSKNLTPYRLLMRNAWSGTTGCTTSTLHTTSTSFSSATSSSARTCRPQSEI